MPSQLRSCALALLSLAASVQAHTVITYPGWRGDTLHTSGSVAEGHGLQPYVAPNSTIDNPEYLYPYGQEWTYPCGGMPISTNRTKWPVKGGAVAFQPGWFAGHLTAYIYINMGYGTMPPNYSNVMVNGIQIAGPTNQPYPGTFCLPQVPLPVNHTAKVGDNATIQVIEAAQHGAALYNCVDITFAEPEDVEEVTELNCFNSSQIGANLIYTTSVLSNDATATSFSHRFSYLATAATIALMCTFV